MDKEPMNAIQAIGGGNGCDLVTGTAAFVARIGLIFAAVSNADETTITSMKEVKTPGAVPVTLTGTHRSYLGTAEINDNKVVVFDNLVKEVTLGAGSLWVFYRLI